MAYYLVTANLKHELKDELVEKLNAQEFLPMRPFGRAITKALTGARIKPDGVAIWEEEDYCVPPLNMERRAVLDRYFTNIQVENIGNEGNGWQRINELPRIFPDVDIYSG